MTKAKTLTDEIVEKRIAEIILRCKVCMWEDASDDDNELERLKNLGLNDTHKDKDPIWVDAVLDLRDVSSISEDCVNGEPVPGTCIVLFKSGRSWVIQEDYKSLVVLWLNLIAKTV